MANCTIAVANLIGTAVGANDRKIDGLTRVGPEQHGDGFDATVDDTNGTSPESVLSTVIPAAAITLVGVNSEGGGGIVEPVIVTLHAGNGVAGTVGVELELGETAGNFAAAVVLQLERRAAASDGIVVLELHVTDTIVGRHVATGVVDGVVVELLLSVDEAFEARAGDDVALTVDLTEGVRVIDTHELRDAVTLCFRDTGQVLEGDNLVALLRLLEGGDAVGVEFAESVGVDLVGDLAEGPVITAAVEGAVDVEDLAVGLETAVALGFAVGQALALTVIAALEHDAVGFIGGSAEGVAVASGGPLSFLVDLAVVAVADHVGLVKDSKFGDLEDLVAGGGEAVLAVVHESAAIVVADGGFSPVVGGVVHHTILGVVAVAIVVVVVPEVTSVHGDVLLVLARVAIHGAVVREVSGGGAAAVSATEVVGVDAFGALALNEGLICAGAFPAAALVAVVIKGGQGDTVFVSLSLAPFVALALVEGVDLLGCEAVAPSALRAAVVGATHVVPVVGADVLRGALAEGVLELLAVEVFLARAVGGWVVVDAGTVAVLGAAVVAVVVEGGTVEVGLGDGAVVALAVGKKVGEGEVAVTVVDQFAIAVVVVEGSASEVSAEEGTVITIAVTDPGARIVGEAVAVGGDYQVPGEARGGLADGRAEGVVQGGDLCGVLAESSGRAAIAVRVEFAEGCGGWSGRGRGRNGSGRRGGGSPDEQE